MKVTCVASTVLLQIVSLPVAADINVGPSERPPGIVYTFDDLAFADAASELGTPEVGCCQLLGDAENITDALTGYSIRTGLANIGPSSDILFEFLDCAAILGPGADIIVFDSVSQQSTADQEIQVRSGSVWSTTVVRSNPAFVTYPCSLADDQFCASGTGTNEALLLSYEVELDDFGLAPDAVVDGLRYRQGGADLVMAGVLNGTCTSEPPPTPDGGMTAGGSDGGCGVHRGGAPMDLPVVLGMLVVVALVRRSRIAP